MVDQTLTSPRQPIWSRIDRAWLVVLAIPVLVLIFDPPETLGVIRDTGASLVSTLPFILFAVLAIGFLKATGAENVVARAFEGREMRMIFLAAAAGALSPFCSCEVIPLIAALLAAGAPLSGVMAFWLASPLMDPAMFAITAGALGVEFAVAKMLFAIALAIAGGLMTMALTRNVLAGSPLQHHAAPKSCCDGPSLGSVRPVWRFWQNADRVATFRQAALANAVFLLKWLTLAYALEALMVRYVPAEAIAGLVGGDGSGPVLLAALVGAPAYLNGYAAPAIAAGLISQGMSPGAAMSFLIAGGVTCVPAAIAVWALVRRRVFALYLLLGFAGAIGAGLIWNLAA